LALSVVGRTVAALAEAAQVRVTNADDVGAHGALKLLSFFGQVLQELDWAEHRPVLFPQAALARAARLLEATAEMLRRGATVAPESPADTAPGLAQAFERDAVVLRELVAEHGTPPGPPPGG
jgi:hypothetical protein